MGGQDLPDIVILADFFRVGTQRKDSLIADASSYRLFVCSELLPILFGPQPERISSNTQTSKPLCLSMLGFGQPATKNNGRVKNPRGKIPLAVRKNFQLFLYEVLVRIWQDLLQCTERVIVGDGISGDPHAEFVVLQAGLDIRHRQIEQIVLRVEEHTAVLTPVGFLDTRYPHTPFFHGVAFYKRRGILSIKSRAR